MKFLTQTSVRRALLGLVSALAAGGGAALAQEAYPARSVTIIVPFTAGSLPDVLARALSEQLSKAMGQPFVVANRDGAGGVIGVEGVARSKPDGYTLGFGPQGQFTIQPGVRKDLKYKTADFEFLCQTNSSYLVVAVGARSPYNSLAELLDAARKSPGKISFGSPGTATGPHLVAESIALEAGVKFLHVPFRSAGDMLTQVLGGTVDFVVTSPGFVTTRKDTKGFAVVAHERLATNPGIPTLNDLGFKRSTLPGFIGLYAPQGMPQVASDALRKACTGAVGSEAFKLVSEKVATPAFHADGPIYSATIKQDLKTMGDLLSAVGIQPE